MSMKDFRSPIESMHVRRQAGQSAQAKADELCNEHALRTVMPVVIVLLAWLCSFAGTWGWLCMLITAILYSVWGWSRRQKEICHWQRGADGERCVGQILDREMPQLGYKVYHDIQVKKNKRKMNIDHLVVGSNGVFLIEDKTWSKPLKGQTVIRCDGTYIYREDMPGKRYSKPVTEAFALAKEANAYLRSLTGESYPVKPVLVFVGWYNYADNRNDSPILVLNERALSSFIPKHRLSSSVDLRSLTLLTTKLDMVA